MEKFGEFRSDEEGIESWLEKFETRLLCHDVIQADKKKQWCQALVGEAGRRIIHDLGARASWDQIKRELIHVLGESNPVERSLGKLLSYKPGNRGPGEVAADVLVLARKATDDQPLQQRLAVKAFIAAMPDKVRPQLKRHHFDTVKQALDEARFLIDVEEEEDKDRQVLKVTEGPKPASTQEIVQECLKQLQAVVRPVAPTVMPSVVQPAARPLTPVTNLPPTGRSYEQTGQRVARRVRCWCCSEEGHIMKECPVLKGNREAWFARNQAGNE